MSISKEGYMFEDIAEAAYPLLLVEIDLFNPWSFIGIIICLLIWSRVKESSDV